MLAGIHFAVPKLNCTEVTKICPAVVLTSEVLSIVPSSNVSDNKEPMENNSSVLE